MFLVMEMGYTNKTVNRSRMFISLDGVHINNGESLSAHCKRRFKRTNGERHELMTSHLDEFIWRPTRSVNSVFGDILQAILMQYPLL